jgi:hypothetical protein
VKALIFFQTYSPTPPPPPAVQNLNLQVNSLPFVNNFCVFRSLMSNLTLQSMVSRLVAARTFTCQDYFRSDIFQFRVQFEASPIGHLMGKVTMGRDLPPVHPSFCHSTNVPCSFIYLSATLYNISPDSATKTLKKKYHPNEQVLHTSGFISGRDIGTAETCAFA